jgi:hypothetical protein
VKARQITFLFSCICAANLGQVRGDELPPAPRQSGREMAQQPVPTLDPGPFNCQSGIDAAPACTPQCGDVRGRFWGSAEYLLWWMKGAPLPPLVTTSPAGTAASQAGVLGAAGTAVLFGGSDVNSGVRSGGRFALGYWLDDCQRIGVEVDFFMLETLGSGFSAGSNGNTILARPFFDATLGRQSSELVAFPGLVAGAVTAGESSTGLLGADALLRYNLCCGCNSRLDVVGGYRFLRLADRVEVAESITTTSSSSVGLLGTNFAVTDRFETTNDFHGFDLGLRGELRQGPWVLAGRADVAVGNNHEVLDINGSTTATEPGAPPVTSSGGLLALQSNIGRTTRDRVVVIPEFGARLGYQLTPRLQAYAGYTFIYWGETLRAGNQIDLTVNPNLLPPVTTPVAGPFRPAPKSDNTSLWIQGIDLGLEFRF